MSNKHHAESGAAVRGCAVVRPRADYRCMVGNRMQNKLIADAGLGITGAFHPIKYTLDWKPDEIVDDARAQKLCDVLKRGINESGELECQSVELLRVYGALDAMPQTGLKVEITWRTAPASGLRTAFWDGMHWRDWYSNFKLPCQVVSWNSI